MMFISTASRSEERHWPEDLDAAKALFMEEVARIVAEGRGELARLKAGTLELRLETGAIYHLGEHSITRVV
jgi:hypothetical protein